MNTCTRCRFLCVDPAQLGRIDEMTTNAEARDNIWLARNPYPPTPTPTPRRAEARRTPATAEFS